MGKYIDASLIPYTDLSDGLGLCYVAFKDKIERIPAADVQEVKHGRWIKRYFGGSPLWDEAIFCSVCDKTGSGIENFCSKCGAKMDGKEETK